MIHTKRCVALPAEPMHVDLYEHPETDTGLKLLGTMAAPNAADLAGRLVAASISTGGDPDEMVIAMLEAAQRCLRHNPGSDVVAQLLETWEDDDDGEDGDDETDDPWTTLEDDDR